MMGSTNAIESLANSDEVIILDRPRVPARSFRAKMPIALLTSVGIVVLASLKIVPIVAAVALGVAVLLISGCMKPKEAYGSVEWSILMIIFGMLALGQAMNSTGASLLIAESLTDLVRTFAPVHLQAVFMLALLYLLTSVFTEFLSNNAAVALMVPIALGIAATLGVDPRPFVVGSCIAASASFATPIGCKPIPTYMALGAIVLLTSPGWSAAKPNLYDCNGFCSPCILEILNDFRNGFHFRSRTSVDIPQNPCWAATVVAEYLS